MNSVDRKELLKAIKLFISEKQEDIYFLQKRTPLGELVVVLDSVGLNWPLKIQHKDFTTKDKSEFTVKLSLQDLKKLKNLINATGATRVYYQYMDGALSITCFGKSYLVGEIDPKTIEAVFFQVENTEPLVIDSEDIINKYLGVQLLKLSADSALKWDGESMRVWHNSEWSYEYAKVKLDFFRKKPVEFWKQSLRYRGAWQPYIPSEQSYDVALEVIEAFKQYKDFFVDVIVDIGRGIPIQIEVYFENRIFGIGVPIEFKTQGVSFYERSTFDTWPAHVIWIKKTHRVYSKDSETYKRFKDVKECVVYIMTQLAKKYDFLELLNETTI